MHENHERKTRCGPREAWPPFCSGPGPGFTLIEIVMVIVILAIMGTFTVQYIMRLTYMNQMTAGQKILVDQASLAVEYLIRELRWATSGSVSCTPACPAGTTSNSTSVTFTYSAGVGVCRKDPNVTGTGCTSPAPSGSGSITYTYNSGAQTLTRNSNGTITTLATNVQTFTINQVSTNVFKIDIFLTGANGTNYSLDSAVRPRNL